MDDQDILNHLLGKTSAEEAEHVLNWLKDPDHDRESRRLLGKLWADAKNITLLKEKTDFEVLLTQIHQQIGSGNKKSARIKRWNALYRSFSRIAAILIIPLFILTVYLFVKDIDYSRNEGSVVVEHEIHTKAGTRTKVVLEDGTIVWLHDGTTLTYPDRFDKQKRQVFVDGEAYFEVAKNPKRPFIVANPMMKTIVTGTKFNLNAYSSDNYFEVTLQEGKVHLQHDNHTYKLEPGQQIQYDKQSGNLSCREVDPSISFAWIKGKLILQDEALGIAAKKLSRWYNIDVVLLDPELKDFLLTATIQDEKPEQTFKLISLAVPISYVIKTTRKENELKQTIYLKKK